MEIPKNIKKPLNVPERPLGNLDKAYVESKSKQTAKVDYERINKVLEKKLSSDSSSKPDFKKSSQEMNNIEDKIKVITKINGENKQKIEKLKQIQLFDSATTDIAKATSDELESGTTEEIEKRSLLELRLKSSLDHCFKKNQLPAKYKISDIKNLHRDFVFELATSLRHGDKNLFFRFYQGPVGEEGLLAKVRSVVWNTILPVGKPYFIKPKIEQDEKIEDLTDAVVKSVCQGKLK